jgi:carbon-monoxide dehydrogenase medium subunit
MKSSAFEYHRPHSLADALHLLAADHVTPLAGGQSLVPMLNFRLLAPSALVDLNQIPELSVMTLGCELLSFGAMVRQRQLEKSAELAKLAPIFLEAVKQIGHRQTRNRGTFGGSLCHLDPSAELPALCLLQDARLTVQSRSATRQISIHDFIQGAMSNDLAQGEILTRIDIAPWPAGHGYAFLEHARRAGDFALSSAGCLLTLDRQGAVERLALCIGGLGDKPLRLRQSEAALQGKILTEEGMAAAAEEARACPADGSLHASAAFKQQIAATLTLRALRLALQRALQRAERGAA